MNVNSAPLIDSQAKLRGDFRALAETWTAVKEDWRDQRRERFEREHLAALGPSLNRLSAALDELCELVSRSERELADSSGE